MNVFQVFNRFAFFFTNFGNLLEVIGAIIIIVIPTAILFFIAGYQTRQLMEPVRVKQALAEMKRTKNNIEKTERSIDTALAMFNKAGLKDSQIRQQLHVVTELRSLGLMTLLKAAKHDNS